MHLLIMGAPGSGKGTCADCLKKHYSIPHISTGDMFRQAIADKTPIGVIAKEHLVPDEVTNEIVRERLMEDDCKKGFLLDGFPRNIEQAKALSNILKELNIELDAAINLVIDDEVIKQRIVNRRICTNCGKGYNLISLNPKVAGICDECGSPLYQRDDDTEQTIEKRLAVYNNQTKPILAYYKELGILVSVNSNQKIDEVNAEIIKKLEAK